MDVLEPLTPILSHRDDIVERQYSINNDNDDD